MDIVINFKTFVDFYRPLLTTESEATRTWFYKETNKKFSIVIPEGSLNVLMNIIKEDIFEESPNKEKMDYEDIMQVWREENLGNAIPFENFMVKELKTINKKEVLSNDSIPIN